MKVTPSEARAHPKALVALIAAVALALLCVQAATAGTTQVSGKQTWTSVPGYSTMDGDLVGDWYDTTTQPDYRLHPSGVIQARGTELFDGCMNETVCGQLTFEYHAEIRVNEIGELIKGRCWHRVTGGTDGFEGATGLIVFRDDPVNGCSDYKGHISLP